MHFLFLALQDHAVAAGEHVAQAAGGGLDPFDPAARGGTLWTWVIFVVALPLMWKIVMGPITKALEGRDEQAARAIVEAEKARDEAAQARREVDSKLAEARADAAKLLAEARARAAVVEQQIVAEAGLQAQRIADDAQRQIQVARDQALAAIREEVIDLSLAGARVVLGRNVGGDDDRRMVREMVGQLKAVKP